MRPRPRRAIFMLLPTAIIIGLLLVLHTLREASSLPPATGGASTGASFSGLGAGLFDLSLSNLRLAVWPTMQAKRRRLLEEDQLHLDHQQRSLPRLSQPYPDIHRWSRAKRRKMLEGLEWLSSHYAQRWPAG